MNDTDNDDLRPEYDFATMQGGERGKYYQAYREGHTVKIHKGDGSTEVRYFTLDEGAIMLDPDVRRYFPTAEAVNEALRGLIRLIPQQPES